MDLLADGSEAVSRIGQSLMTVSPVSPFTLYSLLGNHPTTEALKTGRVSSPLIAFEYADVKVPNTQFKAMMRDQKYDFGELAIVRDQEHSGIVRLVALSTARQAELCVIVLETYGSQLEAGGIVTVEAGRVRVRPAAEGGS